MWPDWDPPYLGIWKYETVTAKQRWVNKGWAWGLSIHCEDRKMNAETHLLQSKPRHCGQKLTAACTTLEKGDLLVVVQGWMQPSKGNSDGTSRSNVSPWGCSDTKSPTSCGISILRDIQISIGQIPKQPDLTLKLTLLWVGVLDQINSSSNLKYSVVLWILASLNKNRPEDWTASIPMESHRGISESCEIFSFIWGTSWDITWREKSKLWYVLTMLL